MARLGAWRPASTRRLLIVLAIVFVVTRLAAGAIADHPMAYGDADIDPGNDVNTYQDVAQDTLDRGQAPYAELELSYPPGALAAFDAPHVAAPHLGVSYRTAFILAMVLVDAIGALLLLVISRRTGHWHGLVAWVLVVPLLGPVVYTRFDLLPAVLTVVAVERAVAGRWRGVGAFLSLSVFTKVYAGFLLPQAVVVAPRRRQVVIGIVLGTAVALVAFIPELRDLVSALATKQGGRGLHWESTWGSFVLVAHAVGYPATIVTEFGAVDIASSLSDAFRMTSTLVTLGVVALTARRCATFVRRGSASGLTLSMFGTVALLVGLGSVYSPQYVLWILCLGAAALSLTPRAAMPAFLALTGVVLFSHLVYPVLWRGLSTGEPLSLSVLVARNILTIAVGVLALRALPTADAEVDA